jgi:N-carbamoyl-L-amino-acid hydrolase
MAEPRSTKTGGGVRGLVLLPALVFLWAASFAAPISPAQGTGSSELHVDSERLQGTLERLSEFGRNPEGGVTRIGFSETDMAAREYVTGLMKQAGLEVRVDPVGNIFGLRAGSEKLPKLLFGSHIDSVLQGGNFDGDVGSMGAIEVIRALNDENVKTRHGLGTLGSGVAAGLLGPEILDRNDEQGLTLADWLRRYGQDPSHLTEARIPPGTLAGFLELHIEQGPNLDEAKIPIGVVQGIVGLKRWKCVATGSANHAGTTPMNHRKDALAAASKDVLAVRDVVRGEAGRQVGTVGDMRAEPGAINVILVGRIPGRAAIDAEKLTNVGAHSRASSKTDEEENVEPLHLPG